MKKTTYTARCSSGGNSTTEVREVLVSLPALPFEVPPAVEDETAPRSALIKGEYDWKKDPILRSAAKVKA